MYVRQVTEGDKQRAEGKDLCIKIYGLEGGHHSLEVGFVLVCAN